MYFFPCIPIATDTEEEPQNVNAMYPGINHQCAYFYERYIWIHNQMIVIKLMNDRMKISLKIESIF